MRACAFVFCLSIPPFKHSPKNNSIQSRVRAVPRSCIAKKAPGWVEYNDMTKSVKFNYVVKKSMDTFTRTWSKEQSWSSSGQPVQGALPTPVEQALPQPVEAPKTKDDPNEKTKTEDDPNEKTKKGKGVKSKRKASPSPTPPTKKGASSEFMAAKKTKQFYTNTMTQVDMVMRMITTDNAWTWANNEFVTGSIRTVQN